MGVKEKLRAVERKIKRNPQKMEADEHIFMFKAQNKNGIGVFFLMYIFGYFYPAVI